MKANSDHDFRNINDDRQYEPQAKLSPLKDNEQKCRVTFPTESKYYTTLSCKYTCTTIPRYPIFSTRYSVVCKIYTGYRGTSEIEYGLCACAVDNPLAEARGLSLRTGEQTMLYLSHVGLQTGTWWSGRAMALDNIQYRGLLLMHTRISRTNSTCSRCEVELFFLYFSFSRLLYFFSLVLCLGGVSAQSEIMSQRLIKLIYIEYTRYFKIQLDPMRKLYFNLFTDVLYLCVSLSIHSSLSRNLARSLGHHRYVNNMFCNYNKNCLE